MAVEENILNIYDFDSLREQIFNCIQNNELIQENKAIFQKEYKIIRKAAIDFIDEVNQKIKEVESHEFYGSQQYALNSIFYLRRSHCLSDTSKLKVYGIANFETMQSVTNLLFFAKAIEVLKKDCMAWIESYRLPLKVSNKKRIFFELWNEHVEKCGLIDTSDFWIALEDIDDEYDYAALAAETERLLLETEKTMHLVDFAMAPFHQFPIENIESLFDLATSQALANLALMEEILNKVNENIFNRQFKT
jgi:hypothetical protein